VPDNSKKRWRRTGASASGGALAPAPVRDLRTSAIALTGYFVI
jgi:hypothetical protein